MTACGLIAPTMSSTAPPSTLPAWPRTLRTWFSPASAASTSSRLALSRSLVDQLSGLGPRGQLRVDQQRDRPDQGLQAAGTAAPARRPERIDVDVPEVARAAPGAAEDLASGDQPAADGPAATQVGGDRVARQRQLDPRGVQRGQLALVADADGGVLDAGFAQRRRDGGTEVEVPPVEVLREAHRRPIGGDRAADADLHRDQFLVGRDAFQLASKQFGDPRVALRPGIAQVGGHGLGPQLAATDGAGREIDLVEIEMDAQHAPRLAVEGDRAGWTAGARAADRVELADQPPGSELADQVGHGRDAQTAPSSNVVAAAGSVVAHIAQDLGKIAVS